MKLYNNVFALFCILILLVGCTTPKARKLLTNRTSVFSNKEITINAIDFDTIKFEDNTSSFVGGLTMKDTVFYFYDKIFGFVYKHSITGKFLGRKLGRGEGPGEIISLSAFLPIRTGYFVFGDSYDFYKVNNNWEIDYRSQINWHIKKSYKQLLKHPNPSDNGIYEITYDKLIAKELNDSIVLLPIMTTHPKLNGYFRNCTEYYTQCSIFGEFNMNTGDFVSMFGRRSDQYLNYHFIPNFDFINFDISDSLLYVNYEPDSLIYVFNYPDSLLYTFGNKGRDMNQNYTETKDADSAFDNYHNHRSMFGYYTGLNVFNDGDLVLRTYHKSNQTNSDGLQIYRSNVLIGDVDVPIGFKILAYNPPYVYAQLKIDEYNEKITACRFRLIENK